jgi:hypothetical protein
MRPVPASSPILHALIPFAASTEVRALRASAEREGDGSLTFHYVLDANLNGLRIPSVRAPRQADELWKHTCFEAFIARSDGYFELNFSPSTEWAAYSFEGYRNGMTPVALASAPRIEVTRGTSQLSIEARVGMRRLSPDAKLRIALSAVIEDDSGSVSYWALKHAPGKPDFHHSSGFILEV